MILKGTRQFLKENGFYLLAVKLLDFCLSLARNSMIARKLRVSQISIGPGARLRGLSFIEMGEDFSTGRSLWLEAIGSYNGQKFSPRIVIGKHVRIADWTHIAATHSIQIGDNVLMGSKVVVIDHNHGQYSGTHSSPHIAPALRPLDQDGKIYIGSNVWLCDGVVVLPGSAIGEGSVIGANSVVKGTIPPFTIAAGAPARVLKVFDFAKKQWTKFE
jgi:Acetyltransferase (isoleucine patch superfamily)